MEKTELKQDLDRISEQGEEIALLRFEKWLLEQALHRVRPHYYIEAHNILNDYLREVAHAKN